MKPTIIVSDLETVPDLAGFAAANDLVGKADAEVRAVLGNQFPKHIYHTIVCIGALGCVRSERAKFGQIRECAVNRQGLFVSS
jgi:hypothetical protein